MNSPAIASRMATPKRKQLDSTTINRRRRISLSEYIVDASPKLRPDRDSQHPPIGRTRTLSLGDTPNRPKITPKRRGKKKTVQVERDQPLIRQMFSIKKKTADGRDGNSFSFIYFIRMV